MVKQHYGVRLLMETSSIKGVSINNTRRLYDLKKKKKKKTNAKKNNKRK